ncbi:MAG: O-antigen ligase family protein [Firmicutes bacterium]|nr:O-antigen ligase family protein [Bacillota bacterium]
MAKKNLHQRKERSAQQPPAGLADTGPKKYRGPKEPKQFDPLHEVALGGLMLLLFFAPYFRGLFFAPEQEIALLFATLIFWLAFLWRQGRQLRQLQQDNQLNNKFLNGPLDWFVLALPLFYMLSFFTAVNKGLAIDAVVKNILYFMVYWSASRLLRAEENIHRLLQVIYVSAIGVALAGLAMAAGIVYMLDGFNVTEYGPTISSTLQYHNALGAFLGAAFLIGLYLWHGSGESGESGRGPAAARSGSSQSGSSIKPRRQLPGYLYAIGNFLLLAVLIGSKSRAGLLVFGLVFVIYLIGAGHARRLTAALSTGYLGAVAYVSISKFLALGQDKQHAQAWLWMAGGLALALVGQFAYTLLQRYLLDRWAGDSRKLLLTFVALAAVVVIAGGVWGAGKTQALEKMTSPQYLWTAYQRMFYINSSLEMIRERPLLGWGGGGWQEAYEAYLHFHYTTREAHSYPFQVGVETGLPGIVIVVGTWLSFLLLVIRGYRNNKDDLRDNQKDNPKDDPKDNQRRKLLWLCTVVFLMLAGHALIDFDLSLSALALILWTVLGITSALTVQTAQAAPAARTIQAAQAAQSGPAGKTAGGMAPGGKAPGGKLPGWKALGGMAPGGTAPGGKILSPRYRLLPLGAITAVGLLMIIGTVFLAMSASLDKQAGFYAAQNRLDVSAAYLQKAVAYNPFASDYRVHLSQVYLKQEQKDQAFAAAQAAVNLSQYNINTLINYIKVAVATGNNKPAAAELDRLPALAPNNIAAYEQYGINYLNMGANELTAGHKDTAKAYLIKAAASPELVVKQADSLTDQDREMWNGPLLEVNAQIRLTVGQADYCLGRNDESLANLRQAAQSTDQNLKAQALLLMALMAEKNGNLAEHNDLIAQVKSIDPQIVTNNYAALQKIPVL